MLSFVINIYKKMKKILDIDNSMLYDIKALNNMIH